METNIAIYLAKATESLLTAENEFNNGRYNSCANRCYYAAFQAAIAALLRGGVRTTSDRWPHNFVQSAFAGQLINRRHRYPPALRSTLGDLQHLRNRADYTTDLITQIEANRGLRHCRDFVTAIQQEAGVRQ
jgi:uncharacterized protein (UPF0332 family)